MQNTKLKKRILLVDDDSEWLEILQNVLKGLDFQIQTARDGIEAELLLLKDPFDLAILDTNMPRMNGIECLKIIRILYPTLPVILLFSGLAGSSITAAEVLKMGADSVLEKSQALICLRPLVLALLFLQDLKRNTPPKIPMAPHQDALVSPRVSSKPLENMGG